MYFTKPAKASYYDCDAANLLKVSAAMRYMQQTSSEQLEALDMSPVQLYRQGMVFLLSKMCVKVHRMPKTAEDIVIGTAATETRGARFVREFVIDSPDGERMISAMSLWLLADTETHKILRPAKFPYPLPFAATMLRGAIDDVKLPKLLDSGEAIKSKVLVQYSHIDTNNHVNNSVYADFTCDAMPYEELMKQGLDMLVISFLSEARHGDTIDITTSRLADKEYYVSGINGRGACFEALAKLK